MEPPLSFARSCPDDEAGPLPLAHTTSPCSKSGSIVGWRFFCHIPNEPAVCPLFPGRRRALPAFAREALRGPACALGNGGGLLPARGNRGHLCFCPRRWLRRRAHRTSFGRNGHLRPFVGRIP